MDTATQDGHASAGEGLGSELRQDARTIGDKAANRVMGEVDARKSDASQQARSVASALEKASGELEDSPHWLRSIFQSGSQTLQKLADTVEQKDAREIGRDVQRIARENPATFISTCALLGFAAARVMKAGIDGESQERSSGHGAQQYDDSQNRDRPAAGSPYAQAAGDDRSWQQPAGAASPSGAI